MRRLVTAGVKHFNKIPNVKIFVSILYIRSLTSLMLVAPTP